MKTDTSLEEAQTILLETVFPVSKSDVSLLNAVGKVVSRDILSTQDVPPFNRSPLDGYALQAKDTAMANPLAPVILEVIEEIRAGYVAKKKVSAGTAIKLMTGTPIPAGADVVIKFEDVSREGDSLKIYESLQAGSNIVLAGEDVIRGEVIVTKGNLLTPPLVGLLAAVGLGRVPVYNKVKVAIFSTGDELTDPTEQLVPGKIFNSNLHSLGAFCSQIGAEPIYLGIVPDEKEATVERINQALEAADIVISTGGVSVGDYDLVKDALQQIGSNLLFWKLNMKPGSPIIAAEKDGKLLIGLSGNPAAAFLTFDLVVVPVIKKLMGLDQQLPLRTTAILRDKFSKPSPQRRFLRAKIETDNQINHVTLTGDQSNGVLKSMIGCNALVDVPAGSGPLTPGQIVSVILMDNDIGCYL